MTVRIKRRVYEILEVASEGDRLSRIFDLLNPGTQYLFLIS